MSRSSFKGPFFLKTTDLNKKKLKKRNFIIMPENINNFFFVHNGKKIIKLKITENMIGHKFGEFVFSRSRYKYKKKLNK